MGVAKPKEHVESARAAAQAGASLLDDGASEGTLIYYVHVLYLCASVRGCGSLTRP